MLPDTNSPTYIDAYSYVKRSKNRQHVVRIISTSRITPSEITEEMKVRFSLVSRVLRELKDQNIVECINEHEKIGKLYQLTDLGLQIYHELESK